MKAYKVYSILIVLFFTGCAALKPQPARLNNQSKKQLAALPNEKGQQFATPAEVRKFSEEISDIYLIGPGDILSLTVWQRPNISNPKIVVGTNGKINILRIGFVDVGGRTINDIQQEITTRLEKFYEKPEVMISMLESQNNRVFVLGRVANPGEIRLPVIGSDLLKVLAMAGGLPVLDERKAPLTECVIIRGKEKLRINLRELLGKGNLSLNARIQNNDVIIIPESGESERVYLLGAIASPGTVRLVSGMTFLDALMMSGGPTTDASLKNIFLVQLGTKQGSILRVSLKNMLENANGKKNILLQNGDLIFVARNRQSGFQGVLNNVIKILTGVNLLSSISEDAGLMKELRKKLWKEEDSMNNDSGNIDDSDFTPDGNSTLIIRGK